jgi:hypothetical protein
LRVFWRIIGRERLWRGGLGRERGRVKVGRVDGDRMKGGEMID